MTTPLQDPHVPFEAKIRDFLLRHHLLTEGQGEPRFREWGVGLSGGGDSVFLAYFLSRLCPSSVSLSLVHFNHRTHPGKNLEDAEFVRDFSRKVGVPLDYGESPSKETHRPGISETVLREERQYYFQGLLKSRPKMALFLAHQRDDRIETVLANLFRGGGPRSIIGISPVTRKRVFRPLLEIGREEIRTFLLQSAIPFRNDPENTNMAHLRNRTRHELRAAIDGFFPPHGTSHLSRLADLMERELQGPSLSPALLCRRESAGIIGFSLFLYKSLRPSAQGDFLRALLNRQSDLGIPVPPERNLLRTLDNSDPGTNRQNFPLGVGWSISIVFGQADLVYKYPGTDKWHLELNRTRVPDFLASRNIALPRGGSLLFSRTDPQESETPQKVRAGISVRVRLCGENSPDSSFSVRYWSPGLGLFPEPESPVHKTVAAFWKDRSLAWARKLRLPILCRGPRALWIPCILDRSGHLPDNGPGEDIQITFQERERSEWKKFLENP